MRRQVKRGGKKQRARRVQERRGVKEPKTITVKVPRGVVGAPDEIRVPLQYSAQVLLYQAGPLEARYVTNGLYDVDPLVGGRSVPYFSEWAALYSFYKVIGYSVHIQGCNLDNIPMTLLMGHVNTDPSTSGIGARDISDGPFGRKFMLGSAQGMNSSPVIKMSHSVRQIVGDRIAQTSERYVGSATANPTDLTYFVVGIISPIGSATTGTVIDVTIRYDAVFFDRKRIEPNATFLDQQKEMLKKQKEQLQAMPVGIKL